MRRISRPCYDKPHRCPGWAGGGMHYPKGEARCEGGHIQTRVRVPEDPRYFEHPRVAKWHFGYCDTCNVMTWPWAVVALAPSNLRWKLGRAKDQFLNYVTDSPPYRIWDRADVWELVAQHWVCPLLGHKWKSKMHDRVCERCRTSRPIDYDRRTS